MQLTTARQSRKDEHEGFEEKGRQSQACMIQNKLDNINTMRRETPDHMSDQGHKFIHKTHDEEFKTAKYTVNQTTIMKGVSDVSDINKQFAESEKITSRSFDLYKTKLIGDMPQVQQQKMHDSIDAKRSKKRGIKEKKDFNFQLKAMTAPTGNVKSKKTREEHQ